MRNRYTDDTIRIDNISIYDTVVLACLTLLSNSAIATPDWYQDSSGEVTRSSSSGISNINSRAPVVVAQSSANILKYNIDGADTCDEASHGEAFLRNDGEIYFCNSQGNDIVASKKSLRFDWDLSKAVADLTNVMANSEFGGGGAPTPQLATFEGLSMREYECNPRIETTIQRAKVHAASNGRIFVVVRATEVTRGNYANGNVNCMITYEYQ